MNERIEELALDAGLLNYVDNETPRRCFIHGHADLEEVQKFAELIVQECLSICQTVGEQAELTNSGEMARKTKATAENCAKMIKMSFGVIDFQQMVEKGTKAWADTPDDWVDELRGGAEKP